jgi:RNA polymerase sigma-70 factor (ECF subfamily)
MSPPASSREKSTVERADTVLIARVLADDDRQAFGELVRRYQAPVRALFCKLTGGNRSRADDLAQETFLCIYRKLHSFRFQAKFSTWLYRIATNVFLSDQRKDKQPPIPLSKETLEGAAAQAAVFNEGATLQLDLESAFAHLHPSERMAIALCYDLEMTHEEAAELMQCPLGTIKSLILRGKAKLRRALAAWEGKV